MWCGGCISRVELPSTCACPGSHWGTFLCLPEVLMLFHSSGILPGCCMVGIRRRSLVSWRELSTQHLCRESALSCSICLPMLPHIRQREMPVPCQVTAAIVCAGAAAQPAVCRKIYSWLLALASSSPSRCQHQCLLDIYSHLLFSGLFSCLVLVGMSRDVLDGSLFLWR